MLENQRKKYKVMDASQKKQMLNRKAVRSRKSYDSMDCEKNEKYLNAIRNQSAIPRNVPCQAVYNDMFVDDIPTELSTLEKLEQILIAQRIVFEKNSTYAKRPAKKDKGSYL